MTDNDIIFQVNVRRIEKPPFIEGSIDIYPKNPLEFIGMLNLVMLTCKKDLEDYSKQYGFVDSSQNLQ